MKQMINSVCTLLEKNTSPQSFPHGIYIITYLLPISRNDFHRDLAISIYTL